MRLKLTEYTVKALPLAEGPQYVCWDVQLPAFGVRVSTRSKSFVIKRNNRYIVLGRAGITTLADARQKAKLTLYAKYLPKTAPVATSLVEDYLRAISADRKPGTVSTYALYLRRMPNKPLTELTPQLLYAALPDGKGAANLCFNVFKAFLSWCVERGHLDENCLLRRNQPYTLKSRERLLTDDEVKAIWAHSYHRAHFGRLLRLSILSGQRIGQWCRPYIVTSTITWPATSMKGNAEHAIPLMPAFAAELAPLPALHINAAMTKMRAALPGIPHWTPHDFRRYFSSSMSKLKVPIDITEAILAHKTGSRSAIQRVYDRDARLPQMRDAFTAFHAHLAAIGCNLSEPERTSPASSG